MDLRKAIVIRNEFTTKTSNGGTRGGSPDAYILDYMSRDDAIETLTPIRRRDDDDFDFRYKARSNVIDNASHTIADRQGLSRIDTRVNNVKKQGGVAFGYGEYSLSSDRLRKASADIRENFEKGRTVMKTVLSFTDEYLKEKGIVDKDFDFDRDGLYKTHVDQLKLRMAIMKGIDRLSNSYDDLQYIGVIQVDARHVHCHLAMVDRGEGTLMKGGGQRGIISAKDKKIIRRGVNDFLDAHMMVPSMESNVDYERHNVKCFVKKFTHQAISERGFSQFLLACLPKNRDYWRADTKRKDMQKANSIVRSYVEELFKNPDSGYSEALEKADRFARNRVDERNLSNEDYRQLFDAGRERIVSEAMDSVYSVLKQVPDSQLKLRTPMMDIMSMPYDDMANSLGDEDHLGQMLEFGFKLRSYKTRLDFHKKERHKYHDAVREYEDQMKKGLADEASRPLYEFFKFEDDYNERLVSKYSHFLKFLLPDEDYERDFNALMNYDRSVNDYESMLNDPKMRRMRADAAERYGINVYGISGGGDVAVYRDQAVQRFESMKERLSDMRDAFKVKLSDYGMHLSDDSSIVNEPAHAFDDVKSLDLHHLLYDFPYDFNVSKVNSSNFVTMADRRYVLFNRAKDYLLATGQQSVIDSLPENDIQVQHTVADRFREDDVLHTSRLRLQRKEQDSRTVRIDYDFYVHQEEDIRNVVKNTISSLQYE